MSKRQCRSARKKRALLLERDGPTCAYCGVRFEPTGKRAATLDHVVPRVRGGHNTDLDNLVLACFRCNTKKGAMTGEEYMRSPFMRQRWLSVAAHMRAALGTRHDNFVGLALPITVEADDVGVSWAVVRSPATAVGWGLFTFCRKEPVRVCLRFFASVDGGSTWRCALERGWTVAALVTPTGEALELARRSVVPSG